MLPCLLLSPQDEHLSDLGYHLDHSHAEDIGINSLGRCVRTRLYFTSESHLHTLLNVMRFPRYPSSSSIALTLHCNTHRLVSYLVT